MPKEKGANPTTYVTNDGKQVIIASGGEQLEPNTYGFEIEFCSHNCPVFGFTHVDVATITITLRGGEIRTWKIESDSGMVFELVTDVLEFQTVRAAYAVKDELTHILYESVFSKQNQRITFANWAKGIVGLLGRIVEKVYNKAPTQIVVQACPYEDVKQQLNVNNVDDGTPTKIDVALQMAEGNKDHWDGFVNNIVLWPSARQSGKYKQPHDTSQVNMPMTLQGFFLYSVKWKLPLVNSRFEKAAEKCRQAQKASGRGELLDLSVGYPVVYCYWLRVIATVCNGYIAQAAGSSMPPRLIVPGSVGKKKSGTTTEGLGLSMRELKIYAFIFILTNKILTGALAMVAHHEPAVKLGLDGRRVDRNKLA